MTFFGLCFIIYLLKLSAGYGLWNVKFVSVCKRIRVSHSRQEQMLASSTNARKHLATMWCHKHVCIAWSKSGPWPTTVCVGGNLFYNNCWNTLTLVGWPRGIKRSQNWITIGFKGIMNENPVVLLYITL